MTTINLSLPSELLKWIDKEAKTELRTRSELLREAARSYLLREQKWKSLQRYAGVRAKTLGISSESDIMGLIVATRRGRRPGWKRGMVATASKHL